MIWCNEDKRGAFAWLESVPDARDALKVAKRRIGNPFGVLVHCVSVPVAIWSILATAACSSTEVDLDQADPDRTRDITSPQFLRQEGDRLYWTDGAYYPKLMGCQKDACAQTIETYGALDQDRPCAAFTNNMVYFANEGPSSKESIWRCPGSGCRGKPTLFYELPATTSCTGLAADDSFLYEATDGPILAFATAGDPFPRAMQSSFQPKSQFASIGEYLYWSDQVDIKRIRKDGAQQSETIVERRMAASYAATEEYLFWIDGWTGSFMRCSISDCNNTATVFAKKGQDAHHLAIYDSRIYWIDPWTNAPLLSCPVEDCQEGPTTVIPSNVKMFAVDEQWIYAFLCSPTTSALPMDGQFPDFKCSLASFRRE